MARGYTTRKLEVFGMHGTTVNGPVDYPALFRMLAKIGPEGRKIEVDEKVIVISKLHIFRERVAIVAHEGLRGLNPLIFNTDRARERIQRLRPNEVLASKTHVLIDLVTREAVVEYNHRGAKAGEIAGAIEMLTLRSGKYESISFELNPVADEGFIRAIDRFERIRLASVRLAKPNPGWSDDFDHLTAMAAESEGRTIAVEVTAGRAKSLARDRGILRFLGLIARKSLSALKGAKIVGSRRNETAETSVSLANHIEHQKVSVKLTSDGHVDDADIEKSMSAFLDIRRKGGKASGD
jgi:hypothetical protein